MKRVKGFNSYSRRIMLIEQDGNGDAMAIVCDKNTRVMYLLSNNCFGSGITVMLDENGKPLLYQGELELDEITTDE